MNLSREGIILEGLTIKGEETEAHSVLMSWDALECMDHQPVCVPPMKPGHGNREVLEVTFRGEKTMAFNLTQQTIRTVDGREYESRTTTRIDYFFKYEGGNTNA